MTHDARLDKPHTSIRMDIAIRNRSVVLTEVGDDEWLIGAGSIASGLGDFRIKRPDLPPYFQDAVVLLRLLEPMDTMPSIGYRSEVMGKASFYVQCSVQHIEELLSAVIEGGYKDGENARSKSKG